MRTLLSGGALLAALLLAACDATTPSGPDALASGTAAQAAVGLAGHGPSAAVNRDLAAARRATAPYQDVGRAVADGWGAVVVSPCVAVPGLGGMGHHYVNLALMNGEVDPAAPEALLYEPQRNGRLRLVAVEYIVPFADEPRSADGGTAPTLFGEHFHESEAAGGWALHAWLWRHNPAGMFADFNPVVSCEYASQAP